MLVSQLKSKIHRAMVTRGDVEYEGSIEIPQDLVEAAGIWPGEKAILHMSLFAAQPRGTRTSTERLRSPQQMLVGAS
ncbi:MAG: aspartate 1-decarboxylase [Bacteroidaceae bacterium]|nr:aspartate 1-decarboxylase [Bacteroidaceae bacterium]